MTARERVPLAWVGLGAVLLVGLGLRLWGLGHGLPSVYNPDERHHFVSIAVRFFEQNALNPDYFVNPPGLTYLLTFVYLLRYGPGDEVVHAFRTDASEVWLLGRATVALLGVVAAWLTYVAGARLFSRGVGLLAAFLISVGFLPVFASHFALNDVPAMATFALGLVGTAGVLRRGRLADYALAGVGLGLACATKYTAGIIVIPLLVAAASRARVDTRRVLTGLGVAVAASLASFIVANPYSVLDPGSFLEEVGLLNLPTQGPRKVGQSEENGITYYLWVLTWGLGWVPSIMALAGGIRLVLVDRWLFAVLVPATLIFILFMGLQERFFGRWLLPVFPLVALLAAYGTAELLRALSARAPRAALPAAVLAVVVLAAQSLVHVVHMDFVLTREDTREIAREWLTDNIPEETGVVAELLVGRKDPRWRIFRTERELARLGFTVGFDPRLIRVYEEEGFCFVVVGTYTRDRRLATPERAPEAVDYYRRLERAGRVVYHVTPYDEGKEPLPFNYDMSNNYYPLSFHRPGPEITIYELETEGCDRSD